MRVAVRVPLGLHCQLVSSSFWWTWFAVSSGHIVPEICVMCMSSSMDHVRAGTPVEAQGGSVLIAWVLEAVYPWSSRVPVSVWGLNGWLQSSFGGWPAQGGLRSHFMMVEGVWGRIKNKLARDFMGWSEIGLFRCFLEPQGRRYGCSVASGSARGGCGGLSSFGKAGWLVPWITHLSASVALTAKIA